MEKSKSILSTRAGKSKQQKRAVVRIASDEEQLQIVPPSSFSAPLGGNWRRSSSSIGRSEGIRDREQAGALTGRAPGRDGNSDSIQLDLSNWVDESTPVSDRQVPDHTGIFGNSEDESDSDREESTRDGDGDSKGDVCTHKSKRKKKRIRKAPEQRITMFVFRVALLEKTASGLGTLAFLWATVVILGGFASDVSLSTFWVVTLIILAEGARIFSRSHELEWHDQYSKSAMHTPNWTQVKAMSGKLLGHSSKPTGNIRRRRWFGFLRGKESSGTAQTSQPLGVSSQTANSGVITGSRSDSAGSSSTHNQPQLRAPLPKRPSPPPKADIELRQWSRNTFPLVPIWNNSLTARMVSRILYLAQLASAWLCIGLSLWKLSTQSFARPDSDAATAPAPAPARASASAPAPAPASNPKPGPTNLVIALNVFFSLGVLEAAFFLLERAYWEYRMRYGKLLDSVTSEITGKDGRTDGRMDDELPEVLNSFLYEVYSRCLNQSVFDGLDMDLVGFGIKWLQSDHMRQQLYGAKLLNRLISKKHTGKHGTKKYDLLSKDALRRLGTTPAILERIVEMLSWTSQGEEDLYVEIARVTRGLVVFSRNSCRFVAVPGAVEAVVSLVAPGNDPDDDEDRPNVATLELQLEGLAILKSLCKDPKNSLKVGDSRGLLSALIAFIEVKHAATREDEFKKSESKNLRKRYKKSLQVIRLLVTTKNSSGGVLRQRLAAIVSGLTNLKAILERFDNRPELQVLAIRILYTLALEDNLRNSIGATGGVIRILFELFTEYDALDLSLSGPLEPDDKQLKEDKREAAVLAGEALTRLMLQNERNCLKLLYLRTDKPLVKIMLESLQKRNEQISNVAANIMRSLLKYADQKTKAEIARGCAPIMITNLFSPGTSRSAYEASLGLVARAIDALDTAKYFDVLTKVDKVKFVENLVTSLRHTPSTKKFPKIRRYAVELIIAMINKDDTLLDTFRRHDYSLKDWLLGILDSISEVENYCLFSGAYGYTRHLEEMEDLVERCIRAVDAYFKRKFPLSTTATEEERAV